MLFMNFSYCIHIMRNIHNFNYVPKYEYLLKYLLRSTFQSIKSSNRTKVILFLRNFNLSHIYKSMRG